MDDHLAVTLFRHGLTEANKSKAYLGWSDSPLCRGVAEELNPINKSYDHYYSSDLGRCLHTFKLLFPNKEPVQLSELREMNFGDWEGKTYGDLKEQSLYRSWITDAMQHSPINGEYYQEFEERVLSGWKKVIDSMIKHSSKQAAVMTHGGVIRLLLSRLTHEQKPFWEWRIPHDQSFILTFDRREERCISLQEEPITAKVNG